MTETPTIDLPQNRPPLSVPAKGMTGWVLHYLFWGSTPPVAALAFGALTGNVEPIAGNFLLLFLLAGLPGIIIILGIRFGPVKALWLRWITAYIGSALVVLDLIAGLLVTVGVAGGGTAFDRSAGEFVLIASVVVGTLCFFMFRAMRQVRWLDPRSTPNEWEPKMGSAFGSRG